ncbi:dethiobiotin synthase [Sporosarcina sp. PTS2304]|uniref:dethiobiotin synthase n=1 Tax=Sporosarcina sp. PTS2304 TaxID=2283194 RepID=UPI000E0CC83B|nr:dethiobiotin synthase [Sporosarcina sp. PTS2304]AXH99241.1 dethiobiotin synthase [Sporosarcina sp. PTS2304]
MTILFVAGTDTDVGKTTATVFITEFLSNHGHNFIPFKPIQTGAVFQNDDLIAPDWLTYSQALNENTPLPDYVFETPCSPHLAASLDQVQINPNFLTESVNKRKDEVDGVVVEGAGGLFVPLTSDGYCIIDWIKELEASVVLVARAGVGTINHTLLSIEAMKARNIQIASLLFTDIDNQPPLIVEDNIRMISKLSNVPVLGIIPYQQDIQETLRNTEMKRACYSNWDYTLLKEAITIESKSVSSEK